MKIYNSLRIGAVLFGLGMVLLSGCGGGGGGDNGEEPISQQQIRQIDERGAEWILADGASIEIPPAAVSDTTKIDFRKVKKPDELKEDAVVYTFTSDRSVGEATFVLPVSLQGVKEKSDMVLLYERERDGALRTVDFEYDDINDLVSFTLSDNHRFQYLPQNAREKERRSVDTVARRDSLSGFRSNILMIRIQQETGMFPRNREPIAMPFFSQMDGTCWAAVGKMVQTSLYPAGESPDDQIYSFMKSLDIQITEGLSLSKSKEYGNAIAAGAMEYETFRVGGNAKARIMQLLNMNRPVIFRRNGHIVLVVGYEESSEGVYVIQHNPQFNEKGMYEKVLFKESFPENGLDWMFNKLDIIELMWSRDEPDEERALQTLEIPDSGSDFDIYFSGSKTASLGSIRIGVYFDPDTPKGYLWKKKTGGGNYTRGAFPENIEKCVVELPVWNADRENSAELGVVVTLAERENLSRKIVKKVDFEMEPESFARKEFEFDIRSLRECMDGNREFELTVELYKEEKFLSEVNLDGIVLKPKEIELKDTWSGFPEPQYCKREIDPSTGNYSQLNHKIWVTLEPDDTRWNGDYVSCGYYESGKLYVEIPRTGNNIDGFRKGYYENGKIRNYVHYKNGDFDGESVQFDTNGTITYYIIWKEGKVEYKCVNL